MVSSAADAEYWLAFDPYVHVRVKGQALLAYNSLTGGTVYAPGAARLAPAWRAPAATSRHFALRVTQSQLQEDADLRAFVSAVQAVHAGTLVDAGLSSARPLQLGPVPRVINPDPTTAGDLRACLREVTLYVNAACGQGCASCRAVHRQVLGCGRFEGVTADLHPRHLAAVLGQLHEGHAVLNVVGGDVFAYPHLSAMLAVKQIHGTLVTHLRNVPSEGRMLEPVADGAWRLRILIPWDFDDRELAAVRHTLTEADATAMCVFLVRSEADLRRARCAMRDHALGRSLLAPVYDGANARFFEDRVFFDVRAVVARRPSLTTIARNQLVNRLAFGRLVIRSDGNICAAVDAPPLGHLDDCTLIQAARRALGTAGPWQTARATVEPCRGCVFDCLCPPISPYERALGRHDLCRADSIPERLETMTPGLEPV